MRMDAHIVERLCHAHVWVAGDPMVDRYTHGVCDRVSPEAPVPVVRMGKEEVRLGGAANVANNLRALGVEVSLCGGVGCDPSAQTLQELLQQQGIHSFLQSSAQTQTIVKWRIVSRNQQVLRLDQENRLLPQCLPQHINSDSQNNSLQALIVLTI